MKDLIRFLKPHGKKMFVGFIIKFTGTIMDLLLPWILAYMIDTVAPAKDIKNVFLFGAVMVICALTAVLTNVWANRMASAVARDTTRQIRHRLFEKISYLSCKEIDDFSIPSLESRMTADTYNVHNMIGMMQRIGIRAPILLIGGICVTLTLEPVLTLILLACLPIMALITALVSKRGIKLYTKQQQNTDNLIRIVRENVSGIRVIKALSKTDYEINRFDIANKNVVSAEKGAANAMALTNPSMNFILNCALAFVIIAGAYRVNSGLSTTGKIIAFLSYFTIILNALLTLTRIFTNYTKAIASMKRISEVLVSENELKIIKDDNCRNNSHIEFENVSFSYCKRKNNVENISFSLKRGESLGIIGATGSGKTTVISLLMRLYDADEGKILINGKDIRSIEFNTLYQMFGVVFQSDALFSDTIYNNIDFKRNLDEKNIINAAKIAQADEFIESVNDKYLYKLSAKGTNLSGGQKQRVLLARAVAKNPEILILDDSSSALDYKTDAMFRKALKKNLNGVTCVIIAQRVSSIKDCSKIMVLDGGKMIGLGTHEQLLKKCSVYKNIADLQMGGNK